MTPLEVMEREFREQVEYDQLLQYVEKDRGDGVKEWHVVCYNDGQTIAVCARGAVGYTWKIGEILALSVAHVRQCHTGRA